MVQIFGSPGKYIQGFGELKNFKQHVSWIGDSFLIIASKNRIKDLGEVIKESFGEGYKLIFVAFEGESTKEEVKRIMDIAEIEGCKGVVGMGGGKVIDTAKAVGGYLNIATIIIPTIAATDAPTSTCACLYNADGSLDEEINFNKNPDIVLVDTEIIMNAPVRFLVAGMGDTLSTYIGARVCYRGYKDNDFGGKPTETSFALAKLSYDLLMNHGLLAKLACEQKVMTKDLNKIIEANILLSGLGFESNGGSSDHSFYYGFCDLTHRKDHMYHGEYVSMSSLSTLVLEGAPKEELDEVFRFCISVGLPVCLEDIKLGDMTEVEFNIVAKGVLRCKSTHNYPFEVTESEVIAALKTADLIGKMYKAGKCLS